MGNSPDAVRVGQVWRDKDKRSPFTMTVTAVDSRYAYGLRMGRKTRVSKDNLVARFRLEREASDGK